jgi:ubiquinone/menaquinone biosynthesis C-methylase UbiE
MMKTDIMPGVLAAVPKDTLLNGKTVRRHSVEINGQTFSINKGPLSFASLEEEWFDDLKDPEIANAGLKRCRPSPDIFTFCQRIPETDPKYAYPMQWESFAVLPVSTYEHWWTKQQSRASRNKVRKSQKAGVEVREAVFDDAFVAGMVKIFNETPVRQGRPFWHYGKNFEIVKREFSTYLFREYLIGAYYEGELIGFVMLADAGRFGVLGQFISELKHRDKGTNNALIAKTVEVCEQRNLPYLLYTDWRDTSLVDFKRYSGFEEMRLPRYFVPLTYKGKLLFRMGLHRGVKAALPPRLRSFLKNVRRSWLKLTARCSNSVTSRSRPRDAMKPATDWKQVWEARGAAPLSDYEFDRGTASRDDEMERLAHTELMYFIDAQRSDVLFDAGCGTGVNIILLHDRVQRIIAMDYSESAVARCRTRIAAQNIANVEVRQGDVTSSSLPEGSVDRVLCMSVLQYLDDDQVRSALREFARVLKPGGTLVLHVKNLSSLYLSTLWLMKRLLLAVKKVTRLEYLRTFGWYVRELRAAGFRIEIYRSLNLLMLERMPRRFVLHLQKLELSRQGKFPFSLAFVQRRGSDLKFRAQLAAR